MNNHLQGILSKGYVLFPKALFEEQMILNQQAKGHFEAFVLVLTHVNYSQTTCCINGYSFECRRGESILTLIHWAEIFGWNRNRTRYFFRRMFDEGFIERLVNPYTTHIRIPDYDLLTGKSERIPSKPGADSGEFDIFWDAYHEITERQKLNIGRAKREWKKLSAEEKKLALDNINEYYFHLSDIKYCLQAANYLSNKAFTNEYFD